MPKEFKVTKMPYMKFLSKYFRMAANLDEKQEAALFELLAHKMGEPCGKRTVEELLEDVPTKIVFDIICDDIDQCSEAYSNTCVTNRENGKKGGAPKGNQNARKKKRPEPEQEPEEVAEDLTDEAEPVPDPDSEPDREPEPDEPLVIDSFIEWRIARMFTELYRKPNNFADFHGEQLAELLAYMAISGIFAQWLEQVNELDTLDAVRDLSKREFDADSSGKDYEAEFMSAKEAALNIIQYSMGSTLAAIEEYNERQ